MIAALLAECAQEEAGLPGAAVVLGLLALIAICFLIR